MPPVARSPAGVARLAARASLPELDARISVCRACPRLVSWREQVAREKRASYAGETVLGPADPGLGRPRPARADRRARPGRARRQPHRPDLHRGPLGRLAVRLAAPGRPRQPADLDVTPTTASAVRRPGSSPRSAAPRRRTSPPPRSATPAPRGSSARCALAAPRPAGRGLPGRLRLGRGPALPGRRRGRGPAPAPEVRPRRRGPAAHAGGSSPSWAASTPRSRTPSPAGSPSRCSTPCSAGPPSSAPYDQPDAPVSQSAEEAVLKTVSVGSTPTRGTSDRRGQLIPPSSVVVSRMRFIAAAKADLTVRVVVTRPPHVLVPPEASLPGLAHRVMIRIGGWTLVATMRVSPGCVGLAASPGRRGACGCSASTCPVTPRRARRTVPSCSATRRWPAPRATSRRAMGSLSEPDLTGDVKRATRVVVRGQVPRTGETRTIETDAFEARALQHEIDHCARPAVPRPGRRRARPAPAQDLLTIDPRPGILNRQRKRS